MEKLIPAKVIRISSEIAQQIADFTALNETGSVSLLVVNNICVGLDTAINNARKPTFNLIEQDDGETFTPPPPPGSDGEPFNRETIYNMIKTHGPIAGIQIGDMLKIGRKKANIRARISVLIQDMRKKGFVTRANDNKYTVTSKPFIAKRKAPHSKPVRLLITEDNIIAVLRKADYAMKTIEVCDALGLDRKKGGVRAKVTRLLRGDMAKTGKIIVNERGGGQSTYELSNDTKVIETVLAAR